MPLRKTLSDLRTAVRDNLDEATASFWSNAQLHRFVNRAKDRPWVEVRKLKEDYFAVQRTSDSGDLTILGTTYAASSFQIAAGTRNYTLPPDFSEMKLIEVTTADYEDVRFLYRDLADPVHRTVREVTDQQTPDLFYFDIIGERTFTIAPLSNTALDLRLTYVPVLPDLSADTDELEMPHPLYMAVEAFATASAQIMDRDQTAAIWENVGRERVAAAIGAHARQTQDPEFVQSALSDYTGW